jgi:hypothetical protein
MIQYSKSRGTPSLANVYRPKKVGSVIQVPQSDCQNNLLLKICYIGIRQLTTYEQNCLSLDFRPFTTLGSARLNKEKVEIHIFDWETQQAELQFGSL